MRIIAHRGNLFGPHTCLENSHEALLLLGSCFDIELDLHANGLYGHDSGENHIPLDVIKEHAHRIWIHAKSSQSLEFALKNTLHCFSHDTDPVVLTSHAYLWRYPNSKEPVTENTIIVMPEREPTLTSLDFETAAGVCTDFPYLFLVCSLSSSFETAWHQGLLLDDVYRSIRNQPDVYFFDQSLMQSHDSRRCLAVYSFLHDYDPQLWNVEQCIKRHFKNQCIYTQTQTKDQNNQGRLHVTWMQMITFDKFSKLKFSDDDNYAQLFGCDKWMRDLLDDAYCILCLFHRVVVFKNTIALLGYTSAQVTAFRTKCRTKFIKNDLFSEPHQQNIVHMTLVRFQQPVNKSQQDIVKILDEIRGLLPIAVKMQKPRLGPASWKMNEFWE